MNFFKKGGSTLTRRHIRKMKKIGSIALIFTNLANPFTAMAQDPNEDKSLAKTTFVFIEGKYVDVTGITQNACVKTFLLIEEAKKAIQKPGLTEDKKAIHKKVLADYALLGTVCETVIQSQHTTPYTKIPFRTTPVSSHP